MLLTICTIPAMAEPERGTLPGGDSFAVTDTTETRQATRQGTPERVTITGKVTDRDSMPLPGVAVVIEGTTVGTSTDPDGNYTLTTARTDNMTLVFSFVGMKTVKETVGQRTTINVVLASESQNIDEVVVTGIYTRNKESFTGSSKTYTSKDLKMVGNTNVLRSLRTLDPSFAIVDNNLLTSSLEKHHFYIFLIINCL